MDKHTDMQLFLMDDFRPYLRAWAKVRGRGEYRRISQILDIHTTLMSQVVSGRKCLTEEQAIRLCDYLGLSAIESDYFLKLVQMERAGTDSLKNTYKRHLSELREQSTEVKSRLPITRKLTEQDRAIFYSSWHYSFIRLMTSLKEYQRPEEIASSIDLSISRVQEILSFLTSRGLCVETDGRYVRSENNTHIEARSPLAVRHHQNWRTKIMSDLEKLTVEDLVFTAPISLARKDIPKIRNLLLALISDISDVVADSQAEEMAYLGIDWIKI